MKRRLSKRICSGENQRTPINSSSPAAAAASSSPASGSASKSVGSKESSASPSTDRVANKLRKGPPGYRSSSVTSPLAAKVPEDACPLTELTGSTIQETLQPKKTSTSSDVKAVQPVQIQLRADEQPVWDRAVEMTWAKPARKDKKADQEEEGVFLKIWKLLMEEYPSIDKTGEDEYFSDSDEISTDSSATPTLTPDKTTPTIKFVRHRSYSDLPPTVRLQLLRCLLAAHDLTTNKAIPLADKFTTSELTRYHGLNQFTALSTLLSPITRYLLINRSFRADVLATVFLTYRFHILVSALTPRMIFSRTPEGQFLARYGRLFANVVVEVDMTKLTGSKDPDAVGLVASVGVGKVKGVLDGLIVKSQVAKRPKGLPLRDFRVLVRRYFGERPQNTPAKFYASSEEVEKVLAPLKSLFPFVEKITISGGVDVTQAMEMIKSVCGAEASLSDGWFERRLPAKEWGAIQGEAAVVDFGTPADGNEMEGLWVVRYTDLGMDSVRKVQEGEVVVGCPTPTATSTAAPDNVKQAGQRVIVLDTNKLSRLPVGKTRAATAAKAEAQSQCQTQAPSQSSSGLSRTVSVSFRRALSAMGRDNLDTPFVQLPSKSLAAEKAVENKLPQPQAQCMPVAPEKEKGQEDKAGVVAVGMAGGEGKKELTGTGVFEEDWKGVKKGDTLRGGRRVLKKLGGALRSLGQN
ncbi:uncharacterized protein CTHT_0018120 [Thermochaetoides thermophila DSM 1495]|uniref:Uncharacterized protein n=1 Tax=Chaetomium thermophilum (strain DSM 1495 / CBS 144.50 / IMI 039719) TaxID=759272 RepID=G0S2Q8_CHATD|nr:hypothetical protein CTHT_0018120 [Thermochaetoides thermophila DSM 1495]EGS22291.1 hypothetical protein CTHT_0018120 [Thermochaetoides thermophila DSM 1495]